MEESDSGPGFNFADEDVENEEENGGAQFHFSDDEDEQPGNLNISSDEGNESDDEDVKAFLDELRKLYHKKRHDKSTDNETSGSQQISLNQEQQNNPTKSPKRAGKSPKKGSRLSFLMEQNTKKKEDQLKDGGKEEKKKRKKMSKAELEARIDQLNAKPNENKVKDELEKEEREAAKERKEKRVQQFQKRASEAIISYIKNCFKNEDESDDKIPKEEFEEILRNIGLLQRPNEKVKNIKGDAYYLDKNEILSIESDQWKEDDVSNPEPLYSKSAACDAIISAYEQEKDNKFSKYVKDQLAFASINGLFVKKEPPKVEVEQSEEDMMKKEDFRQNEDYIQKTKQSVDNVIKQFIQDAFKPTEDKDEITEEELSTALYKLGLIDTYKEPPKEPSTEKDNRRLREKIRQNNEKKEGNNPKIDVNKAAYLSEKLSEWRVGDSKNYRQEQVKTDIGDAFTSVEKTAFTREVKLRLTISIANGRHKMFKKEQDNEVKEKSKVRLTPEELDKLVKPKGDPKDLEEKKERIKKIKKEEAERSEREKKRRERAKEEANRSFTGFSKGSLKCLQKGKNKDWEKPLEERDLQKANENREKIANAQKPTSPKKVTRSKEELEDFHKRLEESNQKIRERAERRKKLYEDKQAPPRFSYAQFEKNKGFLYSDVQRPRGWEDYIKRREEARRKQEEKKEAEEKVYDPYLPSSRKSASSLSSFSTLKQESQKDHESHELLIDDDDIVDPM